MSYLTGQTTSLSDLLTNIQSALIAAGYGVSSGNVVSKGSLYVKLSVVGSTLQILGGTGVDGSGALTGAGPQYANIGVIGTQSPNIVFPATYYIHVLTDPDEVYVFVNHSGNYWQWLAFGQSPAPGITGTGNWYSAIWAQSPANGQNSGFWLTDLNGGAAFVGGFSGALFAQDGALGQSTNIGCNSFFHGGINPNNGGWAAPSRMESGGVNTPTVYSCGAWSYQVPLLSLIPNAWNQQTTLLPINVIILQPSSKFSVIGQIKHSRYTRNDNYADGDIITLGPDKYKIYPFARKNTANRSAVGLSDSGTFALAVRYDGG